MTFKKVKEILKDSKNKEIEKNTYFVRYYNGDYALEYHGKILIIYHKQNHFTLNSHGLRTPDVLSKINRFTPKSISLTQKLIDNKYQWLMNENLFFDGMKAEEIYE